MERYYIDFDGPLFLRYRTQFLPFAELFYNSLNETHIEIIRSHISYFRPYYNSKNLIHELNIHRIFNVRKSLAIYRVL